MGHMFNHFCRGVETNSEPAKRKNEAIDPNRTHLNYNLAMEIQPLKQTDFLKKRLGEVHCLNRNDVNVFCSWVITAPSDLKKVEENNFFKETFNFMQNKYGKENIISAYVHLDETTPHMHFAFVPITYDRRYQRYKVSAKEVITRDELRSIHRDLAQHLEKNNIHCSVLNEATISGNKSINELKNESKQALERATKMLEEADKAADQAAPALREVPQTTLIGNIKKKDYDRFMNHVKELRDLTALEGVRIACNELNETLSGFDATEKNLARVVWRNHELKGNLAKKEEKIEELRVENKKMDDFIRQNELHKQYMRFLHQREEEYQEKKRKERVKEQHAQAKASEEYTLIR